MIVVDSGFIAHFPGIAHILYVKTLKPAFIMCAFLACAGTGYDRLKEHLIDKDLEKIRKLKAQQRRENDQ